MVFEFNRIGSGDEPAARKLLRVLASKGVWFYESDGDGPPVIRWSVGAIPGRAVVGGYAAGIVACGTVPVTPDRHRTWMAVLDAVSDALRARDGYGTADRRSEEEWRALVEGAMS